jgi:hypothetical protein
MNNVQKFLEEKELILSKNMYGYEIPYSYLCKLLEEYAEINKLK